MISNKIYTARVGHRIDLWDLDWLLLPQYRCPGERFPGACVKLKGGTYIIFNNGKVVINGVRDEPDVEEFEHLLNLKLYNVSMSHCSGYMRVGRLNLSLLRSEAGGQYEPELHPGLLLKLGTVSVILYHTGTVMYCGCRTVEQAEAVEGEITELINKTKMNALQNVFDYPSTSRVGAPRYR
jgi:TATA-box binding protein (TBP) (component of TFIID and TFIIIB)